MQIGSAMLFSHAAHHAYAAMRIRLQQAMLGCA
jgi:hypothetical protein